MDTDNKVVVAVRDDLKTWQSLNVVAFLASGLAAGHPELIGQPYADADGGRYLPLFGVPVVVLAGDAPAMRRGLRRACARNLSVAVYIAAMFTTGNDVDNRATVAAVPTADLDPVGLGVCGPRKEVDKALDRLRMHP